MLQNYLKIALRNFRRNKSFTIVNIAGLSVGMAAFLLIALFLQDELSYENFQTKADRVYRLSPPNYARTAPLLATTIKEDFPEIERAIRLKRYTGILKNGPISFSENKVAFASSDILDMFSFDFIEGMPENSLLAPNEVIIDERIARKYFNSVSVIGQEITFLDTIPLIVKGVYKSWPKNSHLQLEVLVSFATYENMGFKLDTWSNNIYYTYVMLGEQANPEVFKDKIPGFLDEHIRSLPNRQNYELVAQNLSDIHLHSSKDMEWAANGNIRTVYIFGALALIILLIAGINFTNLSTAIAARRSKEIGVRKTVGAQTSQLIKRYLAESILMSFFSLILAGMMVFLSLPFLNQLADKTLSITSLWGIYPVLLLFGFTLLVGVLAGLYPALVLSSFKPLDILKKQVQSGVQGIQMRKALVLVQFGLSLFLLVGSIIVARQLKFMQNQALGFDQEQVLILPYDWDAKVQEKYEVLKEQMLNNPQVEFITRSGDIPGRMATRMGYWAEGMPEDESRGMQALYIDKDFSEVYGLEVIAGRTVNNDIASDVNSGFLLNEKAVSEIGWTPEEAIGKRFSVHKDGRVIGVVKDFHYNSLQQEVQPLLMGIRPEWAGYMSLRVQTTDINKLVSNVESIWKTHLPDRPFKHAFLDEDYNRLYASELQMSKIITLFTSLAIFIACIGLFGLTTFSIERRRKEIAVRKVLGASIVQVILLLFHDFLKPILISFLIASPLIFWLGKKWLDNFAYQVTINPFWIIASALILVLLAWLSLFIQASTAAKVNPVKWLKED